GTDSINVNSASAATTVNGGDGNDILTLAAAAASPLLFNGGTNANDADTLNINAGVYTFATDARLGSANLTVNVGVNASASFAATQHLSALNIAGSASVTPGVNKI